MTRVPLVVSAASHHLHEVIKNSTALLFYLRSRCTVFRFGKNRNDHATWCICRINKFIF